MKTQIVAWYAAILSSIVLFWDIYKWWTAGAKLRVLVQTGMKSINMPQYEGKTLITVNVSNYGDRPTTITNLGYLYFTSVWRRLRNRPETAAIVPNPNDSQRLPYELKQGAVWTGIMIQDESIVEMANKGRLYCMLYHSHRKKPVYRRLIFPPAFPSGSLRGLRPW